MIQENEREETDGYCQRGCMESAGICAVLYLVLCNADDFSFFGISGAEA